MNANVDISQQPRPRNISLTPSSNNDANDRDFSVNINTTSSSSSSSSSATPNISTTVSPSASPPPSHPSSPRNASSSSSSSSSNVHHDNLEAIAQVHVNEEDVMGEGDTEASLVTNDTNISPQTPSSSSSSSTVVDDPLRSNSNSSSSSSSSSSLSPDLPSSSIAGQYLSEADFQCISSIISEFAVRFLLPHLSRKLLSLSERVAAVRKGLKNQIKLLFGRRDNNKQIQKINPQTNW